MLACVMCQDSIGGKTECNLKRSGKLRRREGVGIIIVIGILRLQDK